MSTYADEATLQTIADAVKTDDAAFTPGTSKLVVIGAEADETAADSVDEGDAGALRMTLARGLHANMRNASGTENAYGAGVAGVTVPRVIPALVGLTASATFTPAAASHVAPDVFGGAQEFALAAPSASAFRIMSVSMRIDGGTVETTVWRLHLFNVTPPSALADDAAFVLASGDRASYLGYVTIPQVIDVGDTLWIEAHNLNKVVRLAGTSLFAYLVNETTLTPQAVAHTVVINGEPL